MPSILRKRGAKPLTPCLHRLALLFHHRWAAPILAELHRGDTAPGGAKFITLVNRLQASRVSLKVALGHLIKHDLVMRNPGYGHPMRPEYLLTEDGYDIAPACRRVLNVLGALNRLGIAQRKWPLPVILAIGLGLRRFGELKSALPGITARALTLALKELVLAKLIQRRIIDGYPPSTEYRLLAPARGLLKPLRELM